MNTRTTHRSALRTFGLPIFGLHTLTLRAAGLAASALLLAGGVTACGEADVAPGATGTTVAGTAGSSVVVGDPWVRATEGAEDPSMTAAFMTIDNASTEPITLVGASSPVAGTVELHEMSMVDGAMAMAAVEGGILIEPGRGKVLEPGGYHVMLKAMRDGLAPGDEVELTLEFSDGSTEELTVAVKEFTEEEGSYHDHDHDSHDHDSHDHGDEDSGDGESEGHSH